MKREPITHANKATQQKLITVANGDQVFKTQDNWKYDAQYYFPFKLQLRLGKYNLGHLELS